MYWRYLSPRSRCLRAQGAAQAATASTQVFAWNTGGAIIGALGVCFFLLPTLHFTGTVVLAVAISLVLAAGTAWVGPPRQWGAIAGVGVGLLAFALIPPQTPWPILRHDSLGGQPLTGEVAYFGVGRSTTVLVTHGKRTSTRV